MAPTTTAPGAAGDDSRRDAIAAAVEGAAGGVVLLSANPMHDTGGGQRSAQLALELLARDFAVVFVSHGTVTETVDLALRFEHPRLVEATFAQVVSGDVAAGLDALFGLERALVLTQVPVRSWLPILERAEGCGAVTAYDCVDRWDSELGRGWYRSGDERAIASASGLLLASASELVEHVERLTGRPTNLLPNAYNQRVFDPGGPEPDRPADLPDADRVALYVGALWGGWMDWGLATRAAEAHPDTAFVYVGDHRKEGRGLPENCHFLGLKPQSALPAYLAHADVAFLPWSVGPVTQATSPLKVYEFVAMGLPVAAPSIEPLRGIPGVYGATDASDFLDAVGRVGRASVAGSVSREMRDFAAVNSWAERVDRLLGLEVEGRDARAGGGGAPAIRTGATLSVVIPAYRHERFIGEAVDSVRDQTLPAGELIVVDDGSTDGTRDVLADHHFQRMRVYEQPNRGAHNTLNRAIALTRGEYVAILNSDDVLEPERLEHAWGVARDTGAALLCGSVRLIDGQGGDPDPDHPIARWYAEARAFHRASSGLGATLRRHNITVTTSNFFVHRALWDELGGFADYRYVHDFDFLLRARALCPDRVVYVDELCDVRYRVHADNTISEGQSRGDAERIAMRRALAAPLDRARRWLHAVRARPGVRRAVDATDTLDPMAADPNSASTDTPEPIVVDLTPTHVDGAGAVHGRARATSPAPSAELRVGLVVESLGTGGLEEIVALLAQSLPRVGLDVSVLCTGAGGVVADRLARAGVRLRVARGRADGIRSWLTEERIELVSSHFLPVEVVRTIADAGIPVVETVHNSYAWFTEDDWARERAKIESLSGLIATSDVVAAYYGRGTGKAPDRVVPNAVHPGRASRLPRAFARGRLGLPPEAPIFASVGRITEQKNPAGLLRAFARAHEVVPEARLLLAGSDDRSARVGTLRSDHRDLFSNGAVRHLGPLRDVSAVLSAADAFVSNSFYEGWSVAASEAAWTGLPLVLSETGGAAELVGVEGALAEDGSVLRGDGSYRATARGFLVCNPCGGPLAAAKETISSPPVEAAEVNEVAFTDALVTLARDRDQWQQRAPGIRAFARRTVAPRAMAEGYAKALREVLAGTRDTS